MTKSPSFPIQAVIFDLDGVLTDTLEFHYLSWKQLADEEGIPFDREANEALRGLTRGESLRLVLQGREVGDETFQSMMERKNRYYLELSQNMTLDHVLPGVLPLLTELRAAGVRMALGSASRNARAVVQRLGIAEFLDVIGDGSCVTQSKPTPDIFLYAATQLGLDPANCLVVEDAASGVEAALRAGMWVVGLGPEERVGAAHLVFPNLEGVHWVDVVHKLTYQRRAIAAT
ncbi:MULTISPECIES: beta-phosphoglucomutase [unclassified Leptolyngbya]|uniref:beta-phosphoglucomutase n=1 Tax=unclassified Leptolyngbya TaxID=2650499 RepID=UPI001688A7DD|nr:MULTISPECIES: beta-phosphoglucomutase [unclassified Leptolyngbya]MBD1913513.1 beta-phosphoglucomutase [Leptolyngbya sp. FACHB-8]MBD2153265.1 beta-phosphoglucomutase [Leptolyngbya sp. FACHB-16]